jgi:hypothetical protein
MLSKRFQIEDIIRQDQSGVLFHALDRESGQPVALRRFFPFGAGGGGLDPAEQAAYNIAVTRLAVLRHPALRAVVSGGCDPVDGIPFVVNEWIDGTPVGPMLHGGPLEPQAAAELLSRALEVCELLSELLAEEAVWVETDPNAIILCSGESGRGFTFWISPQKWLGGGMQPRGLESIIVLTEQIMGWQGRIIGDQAGEGVGAWLKWLRGAAPQTSLREAREKLAVSLGTKAPAITWERPRPATRMTAQPAKPSLLRVAVITGLALLLLTAGGWLWSWLSSIQPADPKQGAAPPAAIKKQARSQAGTAVDEVNDKAARLREEAAAAWQDGIFQADQGERLALHEGRHLSSEGVVQEISQSKSGATWYILFYEDPGPNGPRGAILAKTAAEGLDRASLEALVGSKVRITGTLSITRSGSLQRPEIPVTDRSAITPIE